MQNISNTAMYLKPVKEPVAKNMADKGGEIKTEQLSLEAMKKQQNQAILQSNMQLSVSAGNEPLSLLYKVAIENINDELKAEFGEDAIQSAYDSGIDVSPEATADRIVAMSTAFFDQYQKQHTDMSDQQAAQSFAEIIGSGIDKGFAEAKDILEGLKVLEGGIAENIDQTYGLVQTGLQTFMDSYMPPG